MSNSEFLKDFKNPPLNYRARPLWFWNEDIDDDYIEKELTEAKKIGYGGVAILPATGYKRYEYLSEGYFAQYKIAIEKAQELGLKLCLYDEFDYPSGSIAGGVNGWDGQFNKKYPNDTAKRLDKIEETVTNRPAGDYTIQLKNDGVVMGAVALDDNHKITVLSTGIGDRCSKIGTNLTIHQIPEMPGRQKIMVFMCVKDLSDTVVDYLEPLAVKKFINEVHETYYGLFSSYFGSVIDSTFYDEPRMWGTSTDADVNTMNCKMWTPNYNSKFEKKYGYSPVQLYPALWYDIGDNTASARNRLFGFRSDLFAEGYIKTINDWCESHGGIQFMGHFDAEEVMNPTGNCGDLIKAFKHQDIPGTDEIFDYYREDGSYARASKSFKIVSSSAYNYDKPFVMTETNGASGQGDVNDLNKSVYRLYKEAFDQLAKGINKFVPHAILSNLEQTHYLPDLSYKNVGPPNYAAELPKYNDFIGRCQMMLQGGRHVADIALVYPIATLHAGFKFDSGYDAYKFAGSEPIAEADYMDVGELLSLKIRRDFTYLHPEVIDEKCEVMNNTLYLNNERNHEQYKIIIVPGSKVISSTVLKKIKQFYDQGGKVIFTKCLPSKSVEYGEDETVIQTITAMLGEYKYGPLYSASSVLGTGNVYCMYEPTCAANEQLKSKWQSDSGDTVGAWLEISFGKPQDINKVKIHECGNAITSYNIEYYHEGAWHIAYKGESLGETDQFITFQRVVCSKVRLHITGCREERVSIRNFQVYNEALNLTYPEDKDTKHRCQCNDQGGKTYFIPNANEAILKEALDDAMKIYDVSIPPVKTVGGNLSYIHKVNYGMDLYYFANSSDMDIDTTIHIGKKITPFILDPHTGKKKEVDYAHIKIEEQEITRIRLSLPQIKSVFICNVQS